VHKCRYAEVRRCREEEVKVEKLRGEVEADVVQEL